MDSFYHVTHFPPLPMKYVTPVYTAEWVYPSPETDGTKSIRIVHADSDLKYSRLCYDLFKKFGHIETKFFKNDPMSFYDWHIDIKRNCGINFLLNEVTPAALTLYMHPTGTRLNATIENVVPILYQPVLLDTTYRHCVINYSQQTRYILSIGMHDENVKFADVKEFLKNYTVTENMYD